MKKVTLATIKSFIKNNYENLYINVNSRFDGMTDAVESVNSGFTKAEAGEHPSHDLNVKGAWFVGCSRDYFTAYDENGYLGYRVSNSCGSFVLAVKYQPEETIPADGRIVSFTEVPALAAEVDKIKSAVPVTIVPPCTAFAKETLIDTGRETEETLFSIELKSAVWYIDFNRQAESNAYRVCKDEKTRVFRNTLGEALEYVFDTLPSTRLKVIY